MFARSLLRTTARLAAAAAVVPAAPRVLAVTSSFRRSYSSGAEEKKGGNGGLLAMLGIAAIAGGAVYFQDDLKKALGSSGMVARRVMDKDFYQSVYNAIAAKLDNNSYDDGSYGPVLVRLAWHAAGTYDKVSGTGGSNGSTMRYEPESAHAANAGLKAARDFLEPIKKQFPEISYADLWSLGGVCAVQELGGPVIPWRAGRKDADAASSCTPDGRLPDATQGQDHIRNVFYRMGFSDQEIVALLGAHALGRCHTDRSGFDGPWTRSPTMFTNAYYVHLLQEKWVEKKWDGPKQFVDKPTGELMMLPADLALIKDRSFYKHVTTYAKSSETFFKDFANAFVKLLELGVPFPDGAEVYRFKPTA
ncbi:heme peroxidase [Irineochytrium annulatum]|nr:heme peroxidase [Irineochytrium annulatum]